MVLEVLVVSKEALWSLCKVKESHGTVSKGS